MTKQIECRIVIIRLPDKRIRLGMFDVKHNKYQDLGEHGPDPRVIDRVVMDLKTAIERVGHRLTFCDRSE